MFCIVTMQGSQGRNSMLQFISWRCKVWQTVSVMGGETGVPTRTPRSPIKSVRRLSQQTGIWHLEYHYTQNTEL